MPTPPRRFRDQGRRIRDARDDLGWDQERLAQEIARQGYGRIVDQTFISKIERGRVNVPVHMRAPMLAALPGLVLDPLDEEDDVAVQLQRVAS